MSTRREELEANLRLVEGEIATFQPTLIVVTKTYPLSDVEILQSLGVENFGENRSSEGVEKSASVAARWHYQGEIQSKKLREISSWADCIHSLDDAGHLEKLDRLLSEKGSSKDIFIQLSLDGDPGRGGVEQGQLWKLAELSNALSHINLLGIMCVPPVTIAPSDAYSQIGEIHQRFLADFPESPSLSAGMSGDYMLALHHGATHIRVGSKILGARQYH